MKSLKYIMIAGYQPILFDGLNHSDLKALGKVITSAGYFGFDENGKVRTFGESLTLHMIPDERDVAMIQKFLDSGKP
jgi:hypothetical protein